MTGSGTDSNCPSIGAVARAAQALAGLLVRDVQRTTNATLGVHDFATVLGLHTGPEADGTLTTTLADLVGIMHDCPQLLTDATRRAKMIDR